MKDKAEEIIKSSPESEKKLDFFKRSLPDKAAEEFNRGWGEFSLEAEERFEKHLEYLRKPGCNVLYKHLKYGRDNMPNPQKNVKP